MNINNGNVRRQRRASASDLFLDNQLHQYQAQQNSSKQNVASNTNRVTHDNNKNNGNMNSNTQNSHHGINPGYTPVSKKNNHPNKSGTDKSESKYAGAHFQNSPVRLFT